MSKLYVLALVVIGCGLVCAQMDLTGYEDIIKVVCVPRLSRDKKQIMDQCDKLIPKFIRTGYSGCVKEVLKITKLTKPALCYQVTDGKKLAPCVQRKEKANAKRLPAGVDVETMRRQLTAEYKTCAQKVL
ncbi:unnamed protein product [Oppiella nova]|uniref:Uncharacterized protein n=1 Tax=Oppiella nova TaxID=334625 RepID=A0A7R9LS84_9ACAR|nr:unnamed protein product [Oppiella nova]CAG2165854.1 unnamed protein product [Oppiella nova]